MKKVLLKGPILSMSGYGEQTRFAFRSLIESGKYDVYVNIIKWGNTGWLWRDTEERQLIDLLVKKTVEYSKSPAFTGFDMSIQVTIPDEWENLAKYNVGYTAGIETDRVSYQWLQKANEMDKVIVVSDHSKAVFESSVYTMTDEARNMQKQILLKTPIDSVGFPYQKPKLLNKNSSFDIEPKDDFNFLLMAQISPRKNVFNSLRWFMEEFKNEEVGLVLKVSSGNDSIIDYYRTKERLDALLRDFKDRKCSVYILHGNLESAEIEMLYNHSKIKSLISLTHGEGFGLPMFEASCNGLPVITTGWSGQVDYLYQKQGKKIKPMFAPVKYKLSHIPPEAIWEPILTKGSKWCYPDENASKRLMRDMYENYEKYHKRAKKLKSILCKEYTFENQSKLFVDALGDQSDSISSSDNVMVL